MEINKIKIGIAGDTNVGKTTFVNNLCSKEGIIHPTIGASFSHFYHNDYQFQIWDLSL